MRRKNLQNKYFYFWLILTCDMVLLLIFHGLFKYISLALSLNIIKQDILVYMLPIAGLSWWVSVCVFFSNKHQNGWTDPVQICLLDLLWPQGRFMNDQNLKNSLQQNSISIKFWKSTKFFDKIRKVFLFSFSNVYKEKMFTISSITAISSNY